MQLRNEPYFLGNSILFYGALVTALVLSLQNLPFPVRIIGGFVYVFAMSYGLGLKFLPYVNRLLAFASGSALLVCYYALLGSAAFYVTSLSHTALTILTIGGTLLIAGRYDLQSSLPRISSYRHVSLLVFILISMIMLLAIFANGRTTASVVTPWVLVPTVVFFLMFCIVFASQVYALRARSMQWLPFPALVFIFFGILLVLFPLGFGFDPFIHEATEKIILASGTLSPKPLYYIGYYSLVVWSNLFLGIPLHAINLALGHLLLALLVPLVLVMSMRYTTVSKSLAAVSPAVFLLFPFSDFFQSTPLMASLIVAIIVVQLSIVYFTAKMPRWFVLFCFAIAAAAFHPLIGLPLSIYVLFIGAYRQTGIVNTIFRYFLLNALAVVAVIITPAALLLAGSISPELRVHLAFKGWATVFQNFDLSVFRFIYFDDLLYSMGHVIPLLLVILAFIAYKKTPRIERTWQRPIALFSMALFASYLLADTFLAFDLATATEQAVFSERLLTLALIFLLPLSIVGYQQLLASLKERTFTLLATLLVMSALVTISWYLLYPRFDTRSQNKGYSPSTQDYAATQWIHEDAGDSAYVVLANQTVSAVAIDSYGFFQYHSSMLYYPLPTNGRLYPQFLRVTREPDKIAQILDGVRSMTGVHLVYIAINDYWDESKLINEVLSSFASDRHTFGNGIVTVYRFDTR